MKSRLRQLPQELVRSGQRHKGSRYLILLLLFLMAAVCRGVDRAKTLMHPAIRRRVLAAALTFCMVFTMMSVQTFAAAPMQSVDSLCEHHPIHTAECGYTEETADSPRPHEHTEDCYHKVTDCIHEHTAECYPADDSVSDREGGLGHDDTCGYTEGTERTPCTNICEICNPVEEDAAKQILAAPAPKAVTGIGWEIDADNNLTISTAAGMTDWVTNGLAANKTTVKTVTIAEAVTAIPADAFYICTALTSVTAPGVTNIGGSTFKYCAALTEVSLPAATSIGNNAFGNCSTLRGASFPAATSIGSGVFGSCAALTEVSLPVAATFTNNVFYGCTSLALLKLGATPPHVAYANSFDGCPTTRALNLVDADGNALTGDSLITAQAAYKADDDTKMSGEAAGNDTWYGWKVREPVAAAAITITVSDGSTIKTDIGGATLEAAITASGLANNAIKTLTVTAGEVTENDWNKLKYLSILTDFTIDEAVTVADIPNAKYTYTVFPQNIVNVSIPQAISIGENAFDSKCKKLASVSIPNATKIGKTAFYRCQELTTVEFPVAESIGMSAFSGCIKLKSASFPKVTKINNYAFDGCAALVTLSLGATPPTVSCAEAFGRGAATRNLSLVDAEGNALIGTDLTAAQAAYDKVADGMDDSTVTDGLWFGWKVREPVADKGWEIDANNNLTISTAAGMSDWVSNGLTANKTTVKTVTIAEAVTAIPENAFKECSELTNVTANGVTTIGYSVFSDCTKLATLTLGATPPTVSSAEAFTNCPSPRVLNLVDASGTDLTGDALTNAQAAYKAINDGDTTDNLWYGWTIEEATEAEGTNEYAIVAVTGGYDIYQKLADSTWKKIGDGHAEIGTASTYENSNRGAMGAIYTDNFTTAGRSSATLWFGGSVSDGTYTEPTAHAGTLDLGANHANIFGGTWIVKGRITGSGDATLNFNAGGKANIEGFVKNTKPVGGYASRYGAIRQSSNSSGLVTIANGAEIVGADCGISNIGANLIITGGTVTGGAYAVHNSNFNNSPTKLSGSPVLTGGTAAIFTGNSISAKVETTAYAGGAITIDYGADTLTAGTAIVTDVTADNKGSFTTTNSGWTLAESGGSLVLAATTPAEAEWTLTGGTKVSGSFADALAAMAANGGSIKLLTAVSTASTTTLPEKAIVLDLNGKVWKSGGEIQVPSGGTLTVTDGSDGGKITATQFNGVSVLAGGTLDLRKGSITSTASGRNGISNSGTLKLSGGTVSAVASTINNWGAMYLSGAPTLTAGSAYIQIKMATSATLIANDGNTSSPTYSTGAVTVQYPNDSVAGYVAVSGLKDADHAKKFTFNDPPTGLTFQYDDVAKTIKLAPPVDKGWAINADNNLTISTQAGMSDWVANGLTANRHTVKTAVIDDSVTAISNNAFYNCSALTAVTANGATTISSNAFYGCDALTNVSFPAVTSIENSFYNCNKLTSVSFPAVTSIGSYAFQSCVALDTLTLPAAPPSVGTGTFQGCPSPRTLALVDANGTPLAGTDLSAAQANYKAVDDGDATDNLWFGWTVAPADKGWAIDADNNLTISTQAGMADWKKNGLAANKDTVKTAVIAEAVTEILSNAFEDCTELTSVTASGVTTIASYAFYGCKKLTSADITGAVSINASAFNKCSALTSASFPEAAAIGPYAFGGCSALTSANIPKVKSIGNNAFKSCAALKTASFPVATTIGVGAFNYCDALTSASFPVATTIGEGAFAGCTALTSASFPVATTIGNYAFQSCTALTTASFPVATIIGYYAFNSCAALKTASFPVTTAIGEDAFMSCTTLTIASFPVATAIGEGAFYGCTKLATLALGAAPPSIVNASAFTNCPATRTLSFVDANGTALIGTALAGAQTAYKAVADGNINDALWYGWKTDATTSVTQYTITLNANGGSVSPATVTTGTDSKLATLPTPSRSGSYRFDGWFTAANGGTQVTIGTVFTSNDTIFAQWTYTGGGGSGGGGSTKPPTTPPTPTDQSNPSKGESTVTAPVDENGNAIVTVTDKNISDAITQAKKDAAQDQPISVSIKVETDKAATQITATLPKTVQETLIRNKVASVTIASNTVAMSFSQTAIQQMNGQAKADITITAAKMDTGKLTGDAKALIGNRPMYDFTATYGSNKKITRFGNNTISIAIPYTLGKGEVAENIQAIYVDDNGKATAIPNSSYDVTRKAVIFITSHFSGYGVGYKQAATIFTDTVNHWAKADIEFAASRGLLAGTGNNKFTPDTAMTRGMFVTALGRLSGINPEDYKTSGFTDVAKTAYYAPYVEWAAQKNIISGTGDKQFSPNQEITREQMAVIMTNYAGQMGYSIPTSHKAVTFTDNASISKWAAKEVLDMQRAGVLIGKNGSRFDPKGKTTRAEAAAVLHWFMELVIDPAAA